MTRKAQMQDARDRIWACQDTQWAKAQGEAA